MVKLLCFKQLLLTSVLLLGSISTFAYDFEVDGIYYNKLSDNTVEVTQNPYKYKENIVIPVSINYGNLTYSVTAIGNSAFKDCRNMTAITIPYKISTIGGNAFNGCDNLESVYISDLKAWCNINFEDDFSSPFFEGASNLYLKNVLLTAITIPDGVTSIGGYAFAYYKRLTSVIIPDEVTSIGNDAFGGCSGLSSVKIGNGVTSIGMCAFAGCSSLTSIAIPDNVTSIDEMAFSNCRSLTSIAIPDNVTSIGEEAFNCCSGLTSATIGKGVSTIGYRVFSGCKSLMSITIPDNVTSIGEQAFYCCSGLESVKIGNGVISIGDNAFYSCSGLTSINIPENVNSIGKSSFNCCNGLISVIIGKGVTSIGGGAFWNCSSLASLNCEAIEPPTCGNIFNSAVDFTKCTLYVPGASLSKYSSTSPWSEFTNIVGVYETCEAPIITFDNDAKKLVFTSATDGAECYYTIISDDINSIEKKGCEATMTGVYTITAYASAEGMYNSEKTTAKLVWVSAAIESDGILKAKADRGVVVSSNGGNINISGTVSGETIEVFNVGGLKVKALKASGSDTTINGLQSGNVYIVKIGGTNVKVAL